MVQSEREEEERIARYIAERDEREAREQAEKERVARRRSSRRARLRAQQEKHADTAAAMDELRAQRIQEAHERAYRRRRGPRLSASAPSTRTFASLEESTRRCSR